MNIVIIISIVVSVTSIIGNMVYLFTINRQQMIIRKYQKYIQTLEESKDEVMDYCLKSLLKEAIEAEGYEKAERCKNLLSKPKTNK